MNQFGFVKLAAIQSAKIVILTCTAHAQNKAYNSLN